MARKLTPTRLAKLLLGTLTRDEAILRKLDRYLQGDHDDPYVPDNADAEYRLLVKRATMNRMPLLVDANAQALYVEDFRTTDEDGKTISPAWEHFERSRLAERQHALYRGSFALGHTFLLADKNSKGETIARVLSAHKTACLYDDPANDIDPVGGLTIIRSPIEADSDGKGAQRGVARMFDETSEYEVTWETRDKPHAKYIGPHGANGCPLTRFAPKVDAEGRTVGLIGPMVPRQDRLNQTVFDLLVGQTGNSFQLRWASGMAPPLKKDENGEIVRDANGHPIPLPMQINGKTLMMNPDPAARFGHIPGAELGGYIEAVEQALEDWAATAQLPPHHMLGQMANLSAEALRAAETSFSRMQLGFKHAFGESWERHFRIVASMEETDGVDDYHGEVVWRDLEAVSLSQHADALGKFAESLRIPHKALWRRVPGVTASELREWREEYDEQDVDGQMAEALWRSTPPSRRREPDLSEVS